MSSEFTGFAWPKVGSASPSSSYWHTEPVDREPPPPPPADVQDDRALGYEAGYAEGKAAAEAEISKTLSLLNQAALELERVGREQTKTHLTEAVDVVQLLFRRIFSIELSMNPRLLDAIRDTLAKNWQEETTDAETPHTGAMVIRFSAQDLAATGFSDSGTDGPSRIVPDANLPSGVVRIQQGSALRELDLCSNLDALVASALAGDGHLEDIEEENLDTLAAHSPGREQPEPSDLPTKTRASDLTQPAEGGNKSSHNAAS